MSNSLILSLIAITLVISIYVIRSLRTIGSKITEVLVQGRALDKKIATSQKVLHQDSGVLLAKMNLLNLQIPGIAEKDFNFILSLTSHPARFDALALALPELKKQVLQPTEIIVNIAHDDMKQLPQSVRDLAATGYIVINESADLGPGKKLIPAVKLYPTLPIIVVDDDLILTPDLTLQLMLEHHLYPDSIIASRTHHVTYAPDGSLEPFSAWEKGADGLAGPSFDLMATSGAGTLFPARSLHPEAFDEARYVELAFHTDDLWWYFQGRRNGTSVRRLPGYRSLDFIPETQDVGLWKTGNKDRNDINFKKLVDEIGVHDGNK
ncbi:hypothetical protein MCEMRE182_01145 [Candidatus Nanopelagicaceae bacterium]